VLQVLSAMAPAAYFSEPDLLPWIVMYMARMSMRSGVSSWSSAGFAGYGMALTGAFGKPEEGAAFGKLALTLADRFENARMKPEVYFVNATFLLPWVRPFREGIEGLRQCYELAERLGVAHYQIYGAIQQSCLWFCEGENLAKTQECAERVAKIAFQRNGRTFGLQAEAIARHAAALRGATSALEDISVPRAMQSERAPAIAEEGIPTQTLLACRVVRADLAYLEGDVASAESHLAEADKVEEAGFASPWLVELRLLHALVDAHRCDDSSSLERIRRVVRLALSARNLAKWARSCPVNFESHALLAQAELSRVCGRPRAAARLYDRAIASARSHGATKREAMAAERAMDLARAHGRDAEAGRCRSLAVDAYRRWGATAKAGAIEAEGWSQR
jgi:hypothetical protein